MNALKLTLSFMGLLSSITSTSVLAGLPETLRNFSGTYQVQQCEEFVLQQSKTAIVRANAHRFEIGVFSIYSPEDRVFQPSKSYSYNIGTHIQSCLTDDCYSVRMTGYSSDRQELVTRTFHASSASAQPLLTEERHFIFSGDQLEVINNGVSECSLRKISGDEIKEKN